ncbi:subtilisin-like protease SBT1.4 [Ipomoea triloba]|uniref:subtilisin-like protease SBT1.4 n=1 Tax=Ipomoea triloba TaxID=35885 RepID=UPI00125E55EC|nr:subtilisin-like protease SBT1.4 [Ipomoea triloba]
MQSSMAVPSHPSSFLFIFLLLLCSLLSVHRVSSTTVSVEEEPESFIVFMSKSKKPQAFSTHYHWYSSIIGTLSPLSNDSSSSELLYTYERVAHGFSARLRPSQASELRNVPGVISVLPDHVHQIQTTNTPQFLGLSDSDPSGLWRISDCGADIIVGVLDTGIWPERASFSGQGLSPRPNSWLSKCQVGQDFPATSCNNKIIGARFYSTGYQATTRKQRIDDELSAESLSPRDMNGHGTHVASTAAGSIVQNANLFGYAQGEARGIAVKAKIAVYKVCWFSGCADSDILAGMDQAVIDGVDVLSLSIGGPDGGSAGAARDYRQDPLAIGAFGAVEHGVNVVCAAGNYGPKPYTARNIAPWILTVGASTINREFPAVVTLGDGRTFTGTSLYSGAAPSRNLVSVIYGGNCLSGQLVASIVTGKIVFCEQGGGPSIVDKGIIVNQAGGVGMIIPNLPNDGYELVANADMIPTSVVTAPDGDSIRSYVRSTTLSPTARFEFRRTVIGGSPSAPRLAAMSGRGPNIRTPEILKPDVIAPGINILAAWTGAKSPSQSSNDGRRTEFNIISGTSMACPHVSGLVALLQKVYPLWNPGAIKSALMTTAVTQDNSGRNLIDLSTGQTSVPYYHGSGHVDPTRAVDPGLVYDTGINDYVDFLCTIGYNSQTIALFLRDGPLVDCRTRNLDNPGSLNYPSFSVVFNNNLRTVKYKRTVKNVGRIKNPVYNVEVTIPSNVRVTVSPTRLVFSEANSILSYEVTFTSVTPVDSVFGSLVWSDGAGHVVSSPIAVIWRQAVDLQAEL